MCHKCEQIILQHIYVGSKLETAGGLPFAIASIQGGKINVETSVGGSKWFHLEHVGLCLHWAIVDGKTIEGVGSNRRYSIRRLVGANGLLVRCQKCEWDVAYVWGILAILPQIKRERRNQLTIESSPTESLA